MLLEPLTLRKNLLIVCDNVGKTKIIETRLMWIFRDSQTMLNLWKIIHVIVEIRRMCNNIGSFSWVFARDHFHPCKTYNRNKKELGMSIVIHKGSWNLTSRIFLTVPRQCDTYGLVLLETARWRQCLELRSAFLAGDNFHPLHKRIRNWI